MVLTGVAWVSAGPLTFDRSLVNMFAPGDPLLRPYEKLRRVFGGNEIVLAVYRDDALLESDGRGLKELSAVRRQLGAVPGVKAAVGLDQMLPGKTVQADDPRTRRALDLFEGYTHSRDGAVAAVICVLHSPAPDDAPRRKTVDQLRRIIGEYPSGMITGEPVMVTDGFRYVEEDGRRLAWASTLLLAATIVLCFGSVRWVLVAVAVVQLALLLTKATLVWLDWQLSMVSSMLVAIITVVGIATVVHVIVRFRHIRLGGASAEQSLSRAGALLAVPIFWACLTTAVGFLALVVAEVGPVQDFGLMMAVGAVAVMVAVVLVVPGLALLGHVDSAPKPAWGEAFLARQLDRPLAWAARRPARVGVLTFLLVGVAAAGSFRLEVETDFIRNFRRHTPVARSYRFVEEHLGGAGVWDVVVPAPSKLDWETLHKLQQLEDRLRREVTVVDARGDSVPGLTKVISLADLVRAYAPIDPDRLPRVGVSARPDWLPSIGVNARDLQVRFELAAMNKRLPVMVQTLYGEDRENPGQHYLRIMLRSRERQASAQKQELIRQVETICRQQYPPTGDAPEVEVTGYFVLLTHLIDSVLRDQWTTFAVATAGITLMMIVAFGSVRLATAALIPNAMPIAVVTGLMGWAGLRINMGAAMIAAVSLGLSIDSSIHYISAFRRARAGGKSVPEALAEVQQNVGRAMTFSTLALIVGFTVLCTSRFVPTVYFGALVSLAMLGGLAGNLIVLPLLLTLFVREKTVATPDQDN